MFLGMLGSGLALPVLYLVGLVGVPVGHGFDRLNQGGAVTSVVEGE